MDLVGKVVIIEHPAMYDRHLVVKVLAQTKTFVTVVGWHIRQRAWSDEPKKRKITHIKKVFGPAEGYQDFLIHQLSNQLMAIHETLMAADKAARQDYWNTMQKLEILQ